MRRLINEVRRYEWGSATAIPELLATEPDGGPQAELWLGAHSGAPSRLVEPDGSQTRLDAAVADAPEQLLGDQALARFGKRLPFLLKVLAAAEPLSLQVHPDQGRARAGFEAEQAAGVPIEAPERNYRDPFHKPELVLALEPFEALCGFRDPVAIRRSLSGLNAELARLLSGDLEAKDDPSAALRAAFTRLLTLPDARRADLVAELVRECGRTLGHPERADRNAAAVTELAQRYPADPGAVAALLLNRVRLLPGEALFLPAGNVHAYLSGTAVEIMAASDNVLRAGLTSKHVDVGELLDTVDFSALALPYVRAVREGAGQLAYRPGIADFALHDLRPTAQHPVPLPQGPAIALVLDGQAVLRMENGSELALRRGQSAFLDAGEPVLARGPGRVVVAALGEPPPTHVTAVTPR